MGTDLVRIQLPSKGDGFRARTGREEAAVAVSSERLRYLDVVEQQGLALESLERLPDVWKQTTTDIEHLLVVVVSIRRVGVSHVERRLPHGELR
ncbi:MAG TPA: hypothetical protein VM848_01785 [Acidimicrobiia bacterium]|nr:hypothetical protein [Acidimicrobiia bacterium]